MIRIRIQDNDVIQYEKKQSEFSKQNRHNSMVKSFVLEGGNIKFSTAPLEAKMIPKKHKACFDNIPFKYIKTDSKNFLLFQDPNNTLQLLKHNDGWIQSVKFDDITEDDDIIIFDDSDGEWAITGIQEIKYYNTNLENELCSADADLLTAMFSGLSQTLSPYMIKLDTGLIVNKILII